MPITRDLLLRGQERYDIYCSPCHDRVGAGEGMIVQRGYKQPSSFHTDRLRSVPDGYLFQVMTNGFGTMPTYAPQVTRARSLGDRRLHPGAAATASTPPWPTCRSRNAATLGATP